jgi:hypothetical protein
MQIPDLLRKAQDRKAACQQELSNLGQEQLKLTRRMERATGAFYTAQDIVDLILAEHNKPEKPL